RQGWDAFGASSADAVIFALDDVVFEREIRIQVVRVVRVEDARRVARRSYVRDFHVRDAAENAKQLPAVEGLQSDAVEQHVLDANVIGTLGKRQPLRSGLRR